jgi:hypothetical protein
VEQVDARTWPQIKALLGMINLLPPPAILEGRRFFYQARDAAKVEEVGGGTGLPMRRGKVKRRNDGD